jgi:hypothetical protein
MGLAVACCATRYTVLMVRPTDLYVLIGVLASGREAAPLRDLAGQLSLDHTVVRRALNNAESAGLYRAETRHVNLPGFEDLAAHAARFVAPAPLGALSAGVPAAWGAEPISRLVRQAADEPLPVWPSARGRVRGQAIAPLHPSAVEAAARNPRVSALLSILDSLRAGDVRVREVAAAELRRELRSDP